MAKWDLIKKRGNSPYQKKNKAEAKVA